MLLPLVSHGFLRVLRTGFRPSTAGSEPSNTSPGKLAPRRLGLGWWTAMARRLSRERRGQHAAWRRPDPKPSLQWMAPDKAPQAVFLRANLAFPESMQSPGTREVRFLQLLKGHRKEHHFSILGGPQMAKWHVSTFFVELELAHQRRCDVHRVLLKATPKWGGMWVPFALGKRIHNECSGT